MSPRRSEKIKRKTPRAAFDPRDAWLNRMIKITIVLIVLVAAAFAGVYYYTERQLVESTPAYNAIRLLEDKVRKNPLDADARANLGVAYIQVRRYDDAIVQFREALKVNSEHQGALVFMGIAYMRKNDLDRALLAFSREIDLYKKGGFTKTNRWLEQAYFNSAAILWQQRKYDDALTNIGKAINIRPTDSTNHLLAGRIYLSQNEYDKAAFEFNESLRYDPTFPDPYYGLGRCYEAQGDLGMAVISYQKAYELSQELKDVPGKVDRLVRLIEKKAQDRPNDPLAQLWMGQAYYGTKKYGMALTYLKAAIRLRPKFADAHYWLGRTYQKRGKKRLAIDSYKLALRFNPKMYVAEQALFDLQVPSEDITKIKRGLAD